MEIREVTPSEPELFARWAQVMREGYAQGREAVWWSSLEALTVGFENPSPYQDRIAAVALDGDEVVGGVELTFPLGTNTEHVSVELAVAPEHRHQGHGRALAEWVREQAVARGRTVAEAEVSVPVGQGFEESEAGRFATRNGLSSENVEDRLIVELPYDADKLAALEASLPDTGDTVVTWIDRAPDEHIESVARMQNQMNEDVPTGTLSRQAVTVDIERMRTGEERMIAQGWVKAYAMALDADGQPAGYSELLISRNEPDFVLQDDTLVLPEHRGRRLGLRLKCANLRAMQDLPDELIGSRRYLQTYTAKDNDPMQRTNAQFGFRPADVLHECEGPIG